MQKKLDFTYVYHGLELVAHSKRNYIIMLMIFGFFLRSLSSNFYTYSFYIAMPEIECIYPNETSTSTTCVLGEVCKYNKANDIKIEYLYSSKIKASYSLITEYKLDCDDNVIAFFTSSGQLATAIAVLVFPFLKIRIGDAKTLKLFAMIGFLFSSLLLIYPSLPMQFLARIMTYGFTPIFIGNFQTYFNDVCPNKTRGFYSIILNTFTQVGGIIISICFTLYESWYSMALINMITCLIVSIFLLTMIADSPIFLFNQGKIIEMKAAMMKISQINKSQEQYAEWEAKIMKSDDEFYYSTQIMSKDPESPHIKTTSTIENEQFHNSNDPLKSNNSIPLTKDAAPTIMTFQKAITMIMSYKDEGVLFISLNIIFFVMGYGMVYGSVQLSYINQKGLISTIQIFLTVIISLLCAVFVDSKKVGRLLTLKILFGIGFFGMIVIYILTILNHDHFREPVSLIITRLSFDISQKYLYLLGSESYSQDIVSHAYGTNLLMARIVGIVAGFFIIKYIKFSLIAGILLYLLAFILVFKLNETADTTIYNTLESKYRVSKNH